MARSNGPRARKAKNTASGGAGKSAAKAGKRRAPARGAKAGRVPAAGNLRKQHATRHELPVVAIGASAGGLDAFKRFLAAMPADSGMAFVLIPHLDPKHESIMVELLAKQTAMPVYEAAHRMPLERDHVYVIPPNRYLAIKGSHLELSQRAVSTRETAIDFALCSLARDRKDAAIGIILSGTGSHGTLGVKEIKLAGGMVMVQDPATAEYDQMPRNALATGVVDHVLPPEKMPDALLSYLPHWRLGTRREKEPAEEALDGMRQVLALLHARRRQDFRYYRKNMIARRILRRMALLQIGGWNAYLERLRNDAEEVTALCRDLLIGVTAFFRDPEAFEVLATHVVPKLVERASVDVPIRVWVPGCASGEEAYSIAILLFEALMAAEKPVQIQIFATDIDERSLETARQGVYPDSIAGILSPERLKRFFVMVDRHHYQVSKQLRDAVVFAQQNLIGDAPFSKLDLISCRNVLIYLEPEVQERIISVLHFALKDGGYLFLGPSESVGRASGMFEPVSKKWRLYRRIGPARRDLVTIPIVGNGERRPPALPPEPARRPASFAQLMQKLLAEDFAPASALVNRDFEILSVQGPLVNYLEFPAGDMTKDLLMMARQGLRIRIRSACQRAQLDRKTVVEEGARVRRNGTYVPCTVFVRPVTEPKEAEGLMLVVFQDRIEPAQAVTGVPEAREESAALEQLESELRSTREDLQSTIEELESSNEELKASNEEIMSMNEELQSTNEELETSKEELQSLNEELATVNSQLQDKIEDLDATNNDLTNLMAATDIPTVFLDAQLKIKRFTPPTSRLLNLLAADVGRPFRDFAPRFKDDELLADAERVLVSLASIEKTVHTDESHWYLRRVLPYRTGDGRIGGVVITFFDITERMQVEARARQLADALHESNDAVIVSDLEGRIIGWNKGAEQAYGYTEAEALGMNMRDFMPAEHKASVAKLAARASAGEPIEGFETKRLTRHGNGRDAWVTVTVLKDDGGRPVALARTERDVTVRRRAEEEIRRLNAVLEQRIAERTAALAASEQRARSVLQAAVDAIITIDPDGRIETFNQAAEQMFGYTAAEIVGQSVKVLTGPAYRDEHDQYLRRDKQSGERRAAVRELQARRKDGTEFPIQLSVSEIPELGLLTGFIRDITEQRALQEEIVQIATLEQRRIGQELHDSTQQDLTGLGLLAENLRDALEAGGAQTAKELAAKLAAGVAKVGRHVRSLAQGVVPAPIPHGLMSGLDDLAKSTAETHAVNCKFDCPEPVDVADENVATHMFRIAQEAVVNAIKHARASTIDIRLERGREGLELEVADDGIGIAETRDSRAGLGLRIMEHRCSIVGGTFAVKRRDSGGTAVSCTIPLPGSA